MSLLEFAPEKELLPCTLRSQSSKVTKSREIDLVVPSGLKGLEISVVVRTG